MAVDSVRDNLFSLRANFGARASAPWKLSSPPFGDSYSFPTTIPPIVHWTPFEFLGHLTPRNTKIHTARTVTCHVHTTTDSPNDPG